MDRTRWLTIPLTREYKPAQLPSLVGFVEIISLIWRPRRRHFTYVYKSLDQVNIYLKGSETKGSKENVLSKNKARFHALWSANQQPFTSKTTAFLCITVHSKQLQSECFFELTSPEDLDFLTKIRDYFFHLYWNASAKNSIRMRPKINCLPRQLFLFRRKKSLCMLYSKTSTFKCVSVSSLRCAGIHLKAVFWLGIMF